MLEAGRFSDAQALSDERDQANDDAATKRSSSTTGVKVPKATMDGLELHRSDFHGEWNYAPRPRAIT